MKKYYKYVYEEGVLEETAPGFFYIDGSQMFQLRNGKWYPFYEFRDNDKLSNDRYIEITKGELFISVL